MVPVLVRSLNIPLDPFDRNLLDKSKKFRSILGSYSNSSLVQTCLTNDAQALLDVVEINLDPVILLRETLLCVFPAVLSSEERVPDSVSVSVESSTHTCELCLSFICLSRMSDLG